MWVTSRPLLLISRKIEAPSITRSVPKTWLRDDSSYYLTVEDVEETVSARDSPERNVIITGPRRFSDHHQCLGII